MADAAPGTRHIRTSAGEILLQDSSSFDQTAVIETSGGRWKLQDIAAADQSLEVETNVGRYHLADMNIGLVSRSSIPQLLKQDNAVNTVCVVQDNLWTDGTTQWGTWWDTNGHPIVGKRTLPNGTWTTQDLSGVSGNPLASPVAADSHNYICLAVSTDGHVHVSGNMHAVALKYARTTTPGDITSFASGTMTGLTETAVTYPTFVKCNDGTLLFFYRDGVSGDGDWYVNKYNATTHAWTQIGKLFDGKTTSESAYPWRLAVSPTDGSIHMFYCWRAGASPDTNRDFCHIKSADNGTTWTDVTGGALTLPITHTTSPKIITTRSTGAGMINSGGADVDSNGLPHCVLMLYDGDGLTQLHHVVHDGIHWRVSRETSFSFRQDMTGTEVQTLGRPAVMCDNAGRTYMLYRHNVDRPSKLMLADITPGIQDRKPELAIFSDNLYYAEITFDSQALRTRNELHCLVAAGKTSDATNPDYSLPLPWTAEPAYVLTVPLNKVAGAPSGLQNIYFLEEFEEWGTASDGLNVALTSHMPNWGAIWNKVTGTGTNVLSGEGRAMKTSTSAQYDTSAVVPVNDYEVKVDIDVLSTLASDNITVWARYQDASNTYLVFIDQSGALQLQQILSGSTTIPLQGNVNLSVGRHTLTWRLVGTSLTVLWDGVPVVPTSGTNPVTGGITSAGKVGIRQGSSASTAPSATTGIQPTRLAVQTPTG